jgi:ankyrin repeat protein
MHSEEILHERIDTSVPPTFTPLDVEENPNRNLTSLLFEIIMCASHGKLEELKSLVEKHNLDINETDYDKRTALHLAAEEGHEDVVDYLLSVGCNVNVVDRWGATPLRGAFHYGHNKIASKLRDKGGQTLFDQISVNSIRTSSKSTTESTFLNFQMITGKDNAMTLSHVEKYLRSKGFELKKNQMIRDLVNNLFDGNQSITPEQYIKYVTGNTDLLRMLITFPS